MKDRQIQKMAEENFEVIENMHEAKVQAALEYDELDKKWKMKEYDLKNEIEDLKKKITQMEVDFAMKFKAQERELLAVDFSAHEREIERLKGAIKEHEHNIIQVEAGKQKIIDENMELSSKFVDVEALLQEVRDELEPQIAQRDRTIEVLKKDHAEVKEILELEMKIAKESCRLIEEQVRKFPNPFELEIKEMRDKYAQMQAGMMKMSMENIQLREEIKDLKEDYEEQISALEDNLKLAGMLLKEVASLGALQSMSKDAMNSLEEALGIDIDGDGQVG